MCIFSTFLLGLKESPLWRHCAASFLPLSILISVYMFLLFFSWDEFSYIIPPCDMEGTAAVLYVYLLYRDRRKKQLHSCSII